MNRQYIFPGFVLLWTVTACAQVSSHQPTNFTNVPAQNAPKMAQFVEGKPVARVNGATLTDTDLMREEYSIFPYGRQHNGIPKEFEKQIHDGALKMIVFEELVYQEAQRTNRNVSAVKLQRAETDFKKQFASPAEFNAFLQSDFHGSRQLLQEKIRRSLLIEAFLKTEVEDKSAISSVELRDYYQKNPARFRRPETFTFQTISILPPPKASAAQQKEVLARAENASKQAKATKTAEQFGLLAEKISDDDYRVMMGQHKPMPAEEIAPPVVKALSKMHPEEMTDLIQVEGAYTIVRLQAHTPAGQTKFEEVKAQLQKELQQAKREQLRTALDRKLRQNAKVEVL